MVNNIPYTKLNDGNEIPTLGLGTYDLHDSSAITYAIDNGYRLIDTAWRYENEDLVGQAVKNSDIDRDELTLATKVWPNYFGEDLTKHAIEKSLERLQTDYIDILYLHWPGDKDKQKESYKLLEDLYEKGIVKAIGVSNFTINYLKELESYAHIKPAINQIEIHPLFQQREIVEYTKKLDIKLVAYTPIAKAEDKLFKNDIILEIADRYDKTPSQIVIRWHLQNQIIPIPKSENETRIEENINVFDFELSNEDMDKINSLDNPDGRIGADASDPKVLEKRRNQERYDY